MQNGYVAKDLNLRWGGQFSPAIQGHLPRNVQGHGVRTVENWTGSPQRVQSGLQWTLDIPLHTLTMLQTKHANGAASIRLPPHL